jgi:hypothetical protein
LRDSHERELCVCAHTWVSRELEVRKKSKEKK